MACFYALTQARQDFDFDNDGYCRFMTVRALVTTGSPLAEGIDPKFHAGANLVMLPLYLVGDFLTLVARQFRGPGGVDYAAELCLSFYLLVTAATCAVLARLCLVLGCTRGR